MYIFHVPLHLVNSWVWKPFKVHYSTDRKLWLMHSAWVACKCCAQISSHVDRSWARVGNGCIQFIILLCPVHTDYLVDQMLESLVHTLSSVHKSLPHEDGVCSKKVDSADEDICVTLTWMSRSAARTWEVSFRTFSTFHILLVHSSKPFKAHSTDQEHGLTHLAHAH